ncbi:MAG: hypothetical protein NTZ05_15885 [Chloroflexi bacterium]|nr:hypothetical protein [Chloroflexota bacterium]
MATLLVLNNVPLKVVAERMVQDQRVTLTRYGHLLPTSQQEASRKLDALLRA